MQSFEYLGQTFRSALLGSLALGALAGAGPAGAGTPRPLNLPAGSLESALTALAAQTGDQMVYAPSLVAGRRAMALSGRFDAETALRRLLGSSDIVVTRAGPNLIVLKARASAPAPAAPQPKAVEAPPFVERGDRAEVEAEPPDPGSAPAARSHTVDEVRVTGTHIRGGSPAAPVIVIDRDAFERSGHATVAAALQALPQNFAGESTEGTVTTRADRLGTNSSFATSINLRGLGSDATLVLVNGRRMAGSGNRGDFADLSSLPTIAVERVEILLDGASALYGSDAVGGVVNVILRRNLEGGELRVRGGTGDGGSAREGLVGAVLGHTWAGGNVLLALETYRREALAASERDVAATADLRDLGGSDRRDTFSYPGNVVRADPLTGVSAPFWGIPAGQSGVGLRPTDFRAGAINLYNQNQGLELLPDQRRLSAYLAWRQDLTPGIALSGDLRYGFRRARVATSGLVSTITVGRNNPFFVSPNGATSNQIQYAFGGELPNPIARASAESWSGTVGAEAQLPKDWRASSYAAFAQELIEGGSTGGLQSLLLSEALGNSADNPNTTFSAGRDGFFNPFTGTPGNNRPAVLAAIGSGFTKTRFKSRVYSLNGQADGTLFTGPGGEVKLAVGAQVRRETFRRGGANYTSTAAPSPIATLATDRRVAALYAEVRAPLFGDDNRRAGLERLELSAALRAERYSDFGHTVNPRIGLQWTPVGGVQVRGTYGESYRAPALQELADSRSNGPVRLTAGADRILSLALQGGNPDLRPETATSWTLGLDLQPVQVPGLRLSATWFRTEFDARIDRPLFNARATALTDPRLAPFVRRITPATNAADLALITALLADPATTTAQGVFPATDYGAIIDQRFVNTAGLEVSGLDVQASYSRPAFDGQVTVSANASRLFDYRQSLTPASPFAELVGQAGFPSKLRGRLSADWAKAPFGVGLAMNYLSGARDTLGVKIGAQTTFDLQARLAAPAGSRFAGTTLSLSVRNLFDKDPPFYDNPNGFGYDPSTGDVIGRFVALQLTRNW